MLPQAEQKVVADSYTESFLSDKSLGISDVDINVWTAVKAEQKALVDEEAVGESGSVFTRRLLWGARDGKADVDRDGAVTKSELYDYVVRESESYCTKYAHRCPQGLDAAVLWRLKLEGGKCFRKYIRAISVVTDRNQEGYFG